MEQWADDCVAFGDDMFADMPGVNDEQAQPVHSIGRGTPRGPYLKTLRLPREAFQQPSPSPILGITKLTYRATTPRKCTSGAAGFDLCSAYDYDISPLSRKLVMTDLSITVPEGCYGHLAPLSGLGQDHFLDVSARVINPDYRGNLGVLLLNGSTVPVQIIQGDRVAQIVVGVNIATKVVEKQ